MNIGNYSRSLLERVQSNTNQNFLKNFMMFFYRIMDTQKYQTRQPLFLAKATRKYAYEPLARSNGMILDLEKGEGSINYSSSWKL